MTEVRNTSKLPVLIAGIIGWAHDGYALVLVSLLATTISIAFGVDKIAIGFVFSAQYVMTVFGAAIFGELADRFGRKNILLLSVLWDSVFTSLSAFAPTFEIFAILRLLSGLGVSWGISFSLLSETFSSKERGFAGGLVHATFVVGYIGAVLVTLIFKDMAPLILGPLTLEGWRICFLSALFPVPFLIYLEFKLDESQVWSDYKTAQEVENEKVRVLDIFKGKWAKYTILLMLLFWLSEFAYHTLSDWAPTYFEYLFTHELLNAGVTIESVENNPASTPAMIVMLGVMVLAAFALVFTGYLSDRIGRRNAFIGCSVIGLIGASIFFIANFVIIFTPLIIIGCLVLTVSFGMHGVFGVWSSETFPTRIRATATSLIFSVARGLAWGAFLVGIIAEAIEPTAGLLDDPLGHAQALAVAMLFCTLAYLAMLFVPRLIPETKGIDITAIGE